MQLKLLLFLSITINSINAGEKTWADVVKTNRPSQVFIYRIVSDEQIINTVQEQLIVKRCISPALWREINIRRILRKRQPKFRRGLRAVIAVQGFMVPECLKEKHNCI